MSKSLVRSFDRSVEERRAYGHHREADIVDEAVGYVFRRRRRATQGRRKDATVGSTIRPAHEVLLDADERAGARGDFTRVQQEMAQAERARHAPSRPTRRRGGGSTVAHSHTNRFMIGLWGNALCITRRGKA